MHIGTNNKSPLPLTAQLTHSPSPSEANTAALQASHAALDRPPSPPAHAPARNSLLSHTTEQSIRASPVGFQNLPVELLNKTLDYLRKHSSHKTFSDMRSLFTSSPSLRMLEERELSLKSHYFVLSTLVPLINSFEVDFLFQSMEPPHCAKPIGALSENKRQEMIEYALSSSDEEDKALAIGMLSTGLEYFSSGQIQRLLDATEHLEVGWDKDLALDSMAAGMAHLTQQQLQQLLDCALQEPDPNYDSLIAGMKYLTDEQRSSIIDAALQLPSDDKATAVAQFGAQFEHLSKAQRQRLITAMDNLELDSERAEVIAGLGSGTGHLDPATNLHLARQALGLDEHSDRATAISGLGAGLKQFDPEIQVAMVHAALSLPREDRVRALQGLCVQFEFLGPEMRQQIIQAALELENLQTFRILGNVLGHLDAGQRQALMTLLSNQSDADPMNEAQAIILLSNGLQHLSNTQHETLVSAAIALPTQDAEAQAISHLGGGLSSLNKPLHHLLASAACELTDETFRGMATAGLITPHLDIDHRETLIEVLLAMTDQKAQAKAMVTVVNNFHTPHR